MNDTYANRRAGFPHATGKGILPARPAGSEHVIVARLKAGGFREYERRETWMEAANETYKLNTTAFDGDESVLFYQVFTAGEWEAMCEWEHVCKEEGQEVA